MKKKIEEKLNEVLGLADRIMDNDSEEEVILDEDSADPDVPFPTLEPKVPPKVVDVVRTDSSAVEVISPDAEVLPPREEPPSEHHMQDVDKDYDYTRRNIYYLIEKGSAALDDLMEYAKQSQEPRAYEVVSELIRTVMEANREVLEIHKSMRKIEEGAAVRSKEGGGGGGSGPKVTNNLAFIGTTDSMSKIAREAIEALKGDKDGQS